MTITHWWVIVVALASIGNSVSVVLVARRVERLERMLAYNEGRKR